MPSIRKALARKAVKSTAKHTAHGTASKLKREPVRATTLLALGSLLGGLAGWLIARSSASAPVSAA
jgi:membrane protein YqaA with SNARE-associated domain